LMLWLEARARSDAHRQRETGTDKHRKTWGKHRECFGRGSNLVREVIVRDGIKGEIVVWKTDRKKRRLMINIPHLVTAKTHLCRIGVGSHQSSTEASKPMCTGPCDK
jgi:hypothetical protein